MNFPLHAHPESLQIPSGANCLICEKKIGEVHGFLRLTTGAILYGNRKRKNGGPSDLMDSIFHLWYHGAHPSKKRDDEKIKITSMDNAEYHMEVVSPAQGGQVDIHFCSSKCLRDFFGSVVDSLESGISTANIEFDRLKVEQDGVDNA